MARDRRETWIGVIHCAATRGDVDIKTVHQWHTLRGIWSDRGLSGYHGLIRQDGTLELGREPLEMGAHALGHNDVSVSVCLAGGLGPDGKRGENNFKEPQWATLRKVVDYWRAVWPGIVICGHRELGALKDCPSFSVQMWFSNTYGVDEAKGNEQGLINYLETWKETNS